MGSAKELEGSEDYFPLNIDDAQGLCVLGDPKYVYHILPYKPGN